MPFEELSHTADLSLRVSANSVSELFIESARGMNALAGVQPAQSPIYHRSFTASAPDLESLLVAFLSELVFYYEGEHLVFEDFSMDLEMPRLTIEMSGVPFLSIDKTIKAVTFHDLKVLQNVDGFQVVIVFDV